MILFFVLFFGSAADVIYDNVDEDANIIFGALVDDRIPSGEVSITVLATGFETEFYSMRDKAAAEAAAAAAAAAVAAAARPKRVNAPPSQGGGFDEGSDGEAMGTVGDAVAAQQSQDNRASRSAWREQAIAMREAVPTQDSRSRSGGGSSSSAARVGFEDLAGDEDGADDEEMQALLRKRRRMPDGDSSDGSKKKRGGIRGFLRRLLD